MFYGIIDENCADNNYIDNKSVCLAEFYNRVAMFENCADESEAAILEAQVEVLYEISIKEIFVKIKNWVKRQLLKLVRWLKKLFSSGKQTKFKDRILKLLTKAEKLLDDVKDAETQEAIERCKKDYEELSKKTQEELDEFEKLTKDLYEKLQDNKDMSDELRQAYMEFIDDVKRIKQEVESATSEEDIDRLEKDLNDAQSRLRDAENDEKGRMLVNIFKRKMKEISK